MSKKKFGNHTKKIFIGVVLPLLIIMPILLPILTPSPVFAAIQNVSEQRDRTILHALYRCLDPNNDPHLDGNFTSNATGDDVRSNNMEGIIASGAFNEDAAVGYEIDSEDGNASCDQMSLTRAMRPIGKTPHWFFNQFYNLSNLQERSDGSGHGYPYREGVTFESVLAKIKNLMEARDLGIGKDERLRRLAGAFWLCAEPAPAPPDRPTSTIGGKKYQLQDGKSDDSQISVGYDLENTNGKFECNTLLNWGNKREMAEALRTNPRGSTPGSDGGGGAGAAAADDSPDCDAQLNSPLSWIVCPLVDMGTAFTDWVYTEFVRGMLQEVPISTDANDGGYKAWQSFRILANIILVGAMLILVYGMIRGGR
jgi:hypothetical protein